MRPALLLILVLLAGCEKDQYADLNAFMAQAGKDGQSALEPLPPIKQIEQFSYVPGEYPDPFKSRSVKKSKSSGGPDVTRQKEYLEGFPLDALHMVGTLEKDGQLYALIKTPDGALHRVKKGNYMGQNYGVVVGISDAAVELKEMVQDAAGDWIESKATVALQE